MTIACQHWNLLFNIHPLQCKYVLVNNIMSTTAWTS